MSQKAVKSIIDEIIAEVLAEKDYFSNIFKALDTHVKNPSEKEILSYLRGMGVSYKVAKDVATQYMASKNEAVLTEGNLKKMATDMATQLPLELRSLKTFDKQSAVKYLSKFLKDKKEIDHLVKVLAVNAKIGDQRRKNGNPSGGRDRMNLIRVITTDLEGIRDGHVELDEEADLEEMTNSAAIQGYNVPGAFSGKGSRKKKDADDARIAHGTIAKQIHSWVDSMHEGYKSSYASKLFTHKVQGKSVILTPTKPVKKQVLYNLAQDAEIIDRNEDSVIDSADATGNSIVLKFLVKPDVDYAYSILDLDSNQLKETLTEGVGHVINDGGTVYVDSDFVNNVKDVLPNSELKHAGMGDFYLQTPDGKIEFNRIGDRKPGMVGRTHVMRDGKGGKLVAQLLSAMAKQKKVKVLKENSVTESASEPQVISDLRDIVKRRQYGKVTDPTSGRKVAVDTFSASAIVQVYDAINDANKSKYVQLPIRKMADTAFKLINKNESVNEATYREFKRDDSLSPRQKIGLKIKEINGSLYRIETAIRQASKLKTERDVTPDNYWDSTHKKMNKISERILKIARELREMK